MRLVIAEKPSVAMSIAKVIGANIRKDGYVEGNGYIVSWCVGHLVRMSSPDRYDKKYKKWRIEDLPIIPENYLYEVNNYTKKQFNILKNLMKDKRVTETINACDAGREGELIFRLVYEQAVAISRLKDFGFHQWKIVLLKRVLKTLKMEQTTKTFINQHLQEVRQTGL